MSAADAKAWLELAVIVFGFPGVCGLIAYLAARKTRAERRAEAEQAGVGCRVYRLPVDYLADHDSAA